MNYDKVYLVNYQWYRPNGESVFLCGFFKFKEILGNNDINALAGHLNETFCDQLKQGERIYIMNFTEIC